MHECALITSCTYARMKNENKKKTNTKERERKSGRNDRKDNNREPLSFVVFIYVARNQNNPGIKCSLLVRIKTKKYF